ncbi:hypothetical protein [Georgenia satyanarayanai]|nr:hypothetical protein [Georgenia satyanarayanai]
MRVVLGAAQVGLRRTGRPDSWPFLSDAGDDAAPAPRRDGTDADDVGA